MTLDPEGGRRKEEGGRRRGPEVTFFHIITKKTLIPGVLFILVMQ